MVIVTLDRKKDIWETNNSRFLVRGWFFILFFIIHYGLFVFIQTSIFAGVSGVSEYGNFGPFSFLGNIFSYLNADAKLVLYIFIMMYGFRTIFDFIINGRYHQISLGSLMFQPYARIFIQQFVVILGSIFLAFGAGKIFMLIFVIVKIYFELFINFDKYLEKAEKLQKLKAMVDKEPHPPTPSPKEKERY